MNEITLTPAAIAQVKLELEKRSNVPNVYLRLGVSSGGCSGMKYAFLFDNKDKIDKDTEMDFDGVKIIIDNKSLKLLTGLTLDYQSTLMKQGFIFSDPNVKSQCGCGKSFSK